MKISLTTTLPNLSRIQTYHFEHKSQTQDLYSPKYYHPPQLKPHTLHIYTTLPLPLLTPYPTPFTPTHPNSASADLHSPPILSHPPFTPNPFPLTPLTRQAGGGVG